MTFADTFKLSLQSLRLSPLRTCLTTLGLAIGVGAVLTVLTLGRAGQLQVETEISRLGVDKIWVTAAYGSRPLASPDASAIRRMTGVSASGRAIHLAMVTAGGKSVHAQIAGVDAQASDVYPIQVKQGRFLSPLDQRFTQSAVVIDESLQAALALPRQDVCGSRLIIGSCYFTISGVIGDQAVQTPGVCDGCAYIPLACFESLFGPGIDEITVNIPQGLPPQLLSRAVLDALPADGEYQAVTLENEIAAARSVIRIFVMVLACVACVCMLVGGVGVMNILLISVRERRREIGILKALGAARLQVCMLFLSEAVLYAAAGALLGLGAGSLLITVTGRWIGLSAALEPVVLFPTLAGACVIGILFGVFPALRAAGLPPVAALNAP